MKLSRPLPPWLRGVIARRLSRPAPLQGNARRRHACLYKLDRIGDFVLATGALRLLVEHIGAENCRMLVSDVSAPFTAAEFPEVARWIAPPAAAGAWREMRAIRTLCAPIWAGESFDALVCLRHARSLYRDLTLSWLRAAQWHGLSERPSAASLTSEGDSGPIAGYPAVAELPWSRELLAHRAVVGTVLGREPTWDEIRPRLRSVQAHDGPQILFCPFGTDPIRDYPRAGWVAAWETAVGRRTPLRVLGTGERRTEIEDLVAELRQAGAEAVACVDASPSEFLRLIASARMVLTVESAAAHLATALDKPAVIVTGGGHFGRFGPWGSGKRQRWLHHSLDCYGCDWRCRRARVECLLDIPTVALAQAIREVLPRE